MKIELNSGGQLLLFIILTLGLLFALFVFQLWLWNVIAVAIFGLPHLSFWQMVGLQTLINLFLNRSSVDNLIKVYHKGEEL